MKKILLLLLVLLATATVRAQNFMPLQMGVVNEFTTESNNPLYLSFTPEETGYYVISATCAEEHDIAFNLWSDSIFYVDSQLDTLLQTQVSHCGYPNKLYAGTTYLMSLDLENYTISAPVQIVIRPGHLISPDPECAGLANVLGPLPVVAFAGQEVKLTVNPGVTVSSLTATSNGQPVAMTVDESGIVYTFTMPDADVVISGSYEIPLFHLGDNEIDLTSGPVQYAFVPDESGAYLFSMNCGVGAQIFLFENTELLSIGFANAGETAKVGGMLKANESYYIMPMGMVEDVVEGVIINIAKIELPPIRVGENVIDVPVGNSFNYTFTPPASGAYRFYTTGDAIIYPTLAIYQGDDMIAEAYYGYSDLDFTVGLEVGQTYTVKAKASTSPPMMSVMHLTVEAPKFNIYVPESFEHGTVTSDKQTASIGETVTLTVTPDPGYELEYLNVIADDFMIGGAPMKRVAGSPIAVTPGNEPNTFTFEMPACNAAVEATFKKDSFTGVSIIDAANPTSGVRYNVFGQRVSSDYKGIVIENGVKKVIR